eukprot:CAMPEP_0173376540 /NCGR_PEP_ID=MMETSP1144-20121109/30224_1 /TAXON_ID=483371 /ORGANISM="non described non described, Strain CCMP2298" /LENGTH=348 /DNA_ID=CAMNT_0014329065 /DNA_START=245 /DNA_END=1288 /DNA_ORIENTATION=-
MASKYLKGRQLGEGTWGTVFEAERRKDQLLVAIKRIKPMYVHLGVNFTALREIKYLKVVRGANVIDLLDVFISDGVLHLVLEHCPFDLERLIRDKSVLLRAQHSKTLLQMLLRGLACCHEHHVLHRDLKPANLLFGSDRQLKLADFGLARAHGSPDTMTSEVVTRWYRAPELLLGARFYSSAVDVWAAGASSQRGLGPPTAAHGSPDTMTSEVVTRWYRAPELLLGARFYSSAVDVWAAGCIFAEIVFRVPLFPGDSDLQQLAKIFNLLGTPNSGNWPTASLLPQYMEFEPRLALSLLPLFRRGGVGGVPAEQDLLLKMLALDPAKRITAAQALQHPYFTQAPAPCTP